ncbi:transposase [Streptomyces noursei]
MPQSFVPVPGESNSGSWSCDCLAHRFGDASDHPDGVRIYLSDRTDAESAATRPLLPVPAWFQEQGGRPEGYCHRQLLDAIRYLVAGGFNWRALPTDFPGWGGVYAFFRRWREHGLITELHDRLRGKVREREGREAKPTAGIFDAQPVRAAATVPPASRGYDGGKKVPGCKRAHRDRHARSAPGCCGHRCGHRRPGCRGGPADAAAPSAR